MAEKKIAQVQQSSTDKVVAVKRPYASPQLKEYGSLVDLTRGDIGFYDDLAGGSQQTPTF